MNAEKETRGRRLCTFLRDLVIPPICPSCAARLPIEHPYAPFCAECRGMWEQEKLSPCPNCGLAMLECGCLPPILSKNGICDAIFLTAYRSGGATVPDRTIYYIKSNRDPRVFDFLGRELAYRVRYLMRTEGISQEDAIITFLPRRRQGVRENGFDQAEVLAASLARALNCDASELLTRAQSGREQKTLNAEERLENLRRAFVPSVFLRRHEGFLVGKCVFLVDDVMTTGSGMHLCAEILSSEGATRVIPVVIARTAEKKKKHGKKSGFMKEPMLL